MSKKFWNLMTLVIIAAMLLAACGGAAKTTEAPVVTQEQAATEVVKPTEVPTKAPTEETSPQRLEAEQALEAVRNGAEGT